MLSNPFAKLIRPRLPRAAVTLSDSSVTMALLERRSGGTLLVSRAGSMTLPVGLVRPSFDEINIENIDELVGTLAELAATTGMEKRKRWSIGLPEATARTSILTLENAPTARGELEEILHWKIERTFGTNVEELHTAERRLTPDARGRARYLVAGVRRTVLAEYETVFASLGWDAGLILPSHLGEAWWLMRDGVNGSGDAHVDSLLVSSHTEGFTAVLLRNSEPLVVRNIACEEADKPDEFYRLLLFYRDRLATGEDSDGEQHSIERLLVTGSDGLSGEQASQIITDTLQVTPRSLRAEDLRLVLPVGELSFDTIAAPAGLAALAWQ